MSADPDDMSNNPYAEGGSSARPTATSGGTWFCHQCQRDIADSDLLRVPNPTCPRCRGDFVEKVDESVDDPHEFDRVPTFPGFPGSGRPPGGTGRGPHPNSPTGTSGGEEDGPGGLLGLLLNALGNASGPLQQAPESQHSQREHRGGDDERMNDRPSGTTTRNVYTTPGGGATFMWSSSSSTISNANRPPPRQPSPNVAASPPLAHDDEGAGNNAPIFNLANFLQSAFAPQPHQPLDSDPQPPRAASAPTSPQQGRRDDAGSPIMDNPAFALLQAMTQFGRQPTSREGEQTTGGNQAGNAGSGQSRGTRFYFGGPDGQGGVAFSVGTGAGGGGQGGAFTPFNFLNLFGGGGGQMGDYAFSEGAFDNIITELMNQASGRVGPQPAPEETIKALPRFKMTEELLSQATISDCAVCKDDFQVDEDVMKLPCNHLYHVDCVKPWLERSGTCPVCRYQLVEQPAAPPAPGASTAASSSQTETSTARSPPIEGGSVMPGGFPGLVFGSDGQESGQEATSSGSAPSASQAEHPGPRGSIVEGHRELPPGQHPDFDLDLD